MARFLLIKLNFCYNRAECRPRGTCNLTARLSLIELKSKHTICCLREFRISTGWMEIIRTICTSGFVCNLDCLHREQLPIISSGSDVSSNTSNEVEIALPCFSKFLVIQSFFCNCNSWLLKLTYPVISWAEDCIVLTRCWINIESSRMLNFEV